MILFYREGKICNNLSKSYSLSGDWKETLITYGIAPNINLFFWEILTLEYYLCLLELDCRLPNPMETFRPTRYVIHRIIKWKITYFHSTTKVFFCIKNIHCSFWEFISRLTHQGLYLEKSSLNLAPIKNSDDMIVGTNSDHFWPPKIFQCANYLFLHGNTFPFPTFGWLRCIWRPSLWSKYLPSWSVHLISAPEYPFP